MTEAVETLAQEQEAVAERPHDWRPPFMFAKRHGVLVSEQRGDRLHVLLSPSVDPGALLELRRFSRLPLELERIDAEQFDALLTTSYEQGSNEAMQMMEDLGDDLDLFQVAQALPETEDLLESEDDAPIIRLINAL